MIDFHCHIDLFPDPEAVIRDADAAGIYVLAVTTTPKSFRHLERLLAGKRRIRPAIGLHPELVKERFSELKELQALLPESRYVGEVGLDGTPNHAGSMGKQKEVFESVLAGCAELGGRILSIHSRGAARCVLDLLEKYPNAGTPVLHWFSGSDNEASRAAELGCWFSVGPAMLQSAKGRKLAMAMPQSKVLTETDGPFAQVNFKSIAPPDIIDAERALATIWGTTHPSAKAILDRNFKALVSSPASGWRE